MKPSCRQSVSVILVSSWQIYKLLAVSVPMSKHCRRSRSRSCGQVQEAQFGLTAGQAEDQARQEQSGYVSLRLVQQSKPDKRNSKWQLARLKLESVLVKKRHSLVCQHSNRKMRHVRLRSSLVNKHSSRLRQGEGAQQELDVRLSKLASQHDSRRPS